MPKIIKYKSTDDLAKVLADNNIKYCNSVIYCKSEAEANVYSEMIMRFAGGVKGVEHLCGNIAICIDPDSTKIAGMHLLAYKMPNNIKSSYPFQLQAKKIGQEKQDEILKACGLNTEKELRAIWEYCAGRLTFPIVATPDEREEFSKIFESAGNILLLRKENNKNKFIKEINNKVDVITQWFTNKFGNNFYISDYYNVHSWKVKYDDAGYKTYTFMFAMEHSESDGITKFRISYLGLDFAMGFPWKQDDNIDIILKRVEILWEQFTAIMEAMTKTRIACSMEIKVPQN